MSRRFYHKVRVVLVSLGLGGASVFTTLVLPNCRRDVVIIEPAPLSVDDGLFIPDACDAPDEQATPIQLP